MQQGEGGKSKKLIQAIVWAGLLAGSLDIVAACGLYSIRSGNDPFNVLRFIASGALGMDAFSGGLIVAFLGLLFHFIIAYSWTAVYFLAYPKLPWRGNRIIHGIFFGILIWLVMNLAVLPLSLVPSAPFNIKQAITGTIILITMVGLPVSFLAARHYR